MSNWYAIAPGEVGDHLAVSTTPLSYEAAFLRAQELARTTGITHRVVRINEIAVYPAGRVQSK